jgi:hypothetical protein
MRILFFVLVFVSTYSHASGGPEEIPLTQELAKSLGFTVAVKAEGSAIIIELKGPIKNSHGCPASRSGSYLLGSAGEELIVHITELPEAMSQPEAIGYYTNKSHTMGVFIDYLCKNESVLNSARYSVPSISNWLIKN